MNSASIARFCPPWAASGVPLLEVGSGAATAGDACDAAAAGDVDAGAASAVGAAAASWDDAEAAAPVSEPAGGAAWLLSLLFLFRRFLSIRPRPGRLPLGNSEFSPPTLPCTGCSSCPSSPVWEPTPGPGDVSALSLDPPASPEHRRILRVLGLHLLVSRSSNFRSGARPETALLGLSLAGGSE